MARLVTWLKGMLSVSLAVAVLIGCSDSNGDSDGGGAPPAITSTPPTMDTAGTPYTYTITATGSPAPTINVSGLPSWLAFNGVNTISGTPTPANVGATGTITVTASNGVIPDDTQSFTIDVSLPYLTLKFDTEASSPAYQGLWGSADVDIDGNNVADLFLDNVTDGIYLEGVAFTEITRQPWPTLASVAPAFSGPVNLDTDVDKEFVLLDATVSPQQIRIVNASTYVTEWTYDLPVGWMTLQQEVADINGDGSFEIIVVLMAGFTTRTMVLRHNGSALTAVFDTETGPVAYQGLWGSANEDIDGDNVPELVLDGGNAIYLEGATFTEVTQQPWPTLGRVSPAFSGPVNLDMDAGKEFVLLDTASVPNAVNILSAIAPFATEWTYSLPAGWTATESEIGDIDGDTVHEIIVRLTDGTNSRTIVLRHNGSALNVAFDTETASAYMGLMGRAGQDIDGDGIPELVLNNNDVEAIYLEGSTFTEVTRQPWPTLARVDAAFSAAANLDGDADKEFLLIDTSSSPGVVYVVNAATYLNEWKYDLPAGWSPMEKELGDIDGDGIYEIIIVLSDGANTRTIVLKAE